MRLSKDGRTVELANEAHIAAYVRSGWVEVAKVEEKPKPKRKAKTE